jgi:D-arabinose 1-dehydrogenase-like Zn-dependent alcohol dehydrogenase
MAPFGHIYVQYSLLRTEGLSFLTSCFFVKELSIHGSCSSSSEEIKKMLSFIVDHKIKPKVEKFPISAEGIT